MKQCKGMNRLFGYGISFLVVTLFWQSPAARADIGVSTANVAVGDLNAYGQLAQITDEVMKEYLLQRLVLSQAELIDAQTHGIEQQIEYWRNINLAASRELQHQSEERAFSEEKLRDIEIKSNLIRPLRLGRTDSNVFYGLNHFFEFYIPAYVVKETMSTRVDALPKANFVANDPATSVLEDFPAGDVGALLNFMETNNVSAKKWSAAHYTLLGMLTSLSTSAEEKVKEIRTYIDGLHKGTINVMTTPPPK